MLVKLGTLLKYYPSDTQVLLQIRYRREMPGPSCLVPLLSDSGSDLDPDQTRTHARGNGVFSWATAERARQICLASPPWTPLGLLGHFHQRWRELYQVDYPSRNSFGADFRLMELLCTKLTAETVYWCIEAFFSPKMKWVDVKRLDFILDMDKCIRHVLGIAKSMQGEEAIKPEWHANGTTKSSVLHNPLARG